ncbi:hypothetical protein QBC35DRAFT_124439 [Podospora australis]|uniref:Uncharacterized protein n=1 Tax=Podospora australis TaxID=1536484 RepID=A0AAN7AKY8_9PEZI|nr:hypothetical protein QBC35DRAFT_124439 [Podospora australis]
MRCRAASQANGKADNASNPALKLLTEFPRRKHLNSIGIWTPSHSVYLQPRPISTSIQTAQPFRLLLLPFPSHPVCLPHQTSKTIVTQTEQDERRRLLHTICGTHRPIRTVCVRPALCRVLAVLGLGEGRSGSSAVPRILPPKSNSASTTPPPPQPQAQPKFVASSQSRYTCNHSKIHHLDRIFTCGRTSRLEFCPQVDLHWTSSCTTL